MIGIRVTVSNLPRVHDTLLPSFVLGFALAVFAYNTCDFCLYYADSISILELLPLRPRLPDRPSTDVPLYVKRLTADMDRVVTGWRILPSVTLLASVFIEQLDVTSGSRSVLPTPLVRCVLELVPRGRMESPSSGFQQFRNEAVPPG